eukprot:scaffold7963_cov116-Isochrysis_galbana.AAC.19
MATRATCFAEERSPTKKNITGTPPHACTEEKHTHRVIEVGKESLAVANGHTLDARAIIAAIMLWIMHECGTTWPLAGSCAAERPSSAIALLEPSAGCAFVVETPRGLCVPSTPFPRRAPRTNRPPVVPARAAARLRRRRAVAAAGQTARACALSPASRARPDGPAILSL